MTDPLEQVAAITRTLHQIDQGRALLEKERNTAIRAAYADGTTIAKLTRVTGLSRTMIYRIIG